MCIYKQIMHFEEILRMLTGDQLRMARALLRLSMRETAKLSGIDPSTIVRIEAGEKAYRLTLDRLREVLEAKGVRFIPALEGDHEAGVALRWGAELSQRSSWNDETPKSDKGPDRSAASTWDDFAEGEPVPSEIEDLRTFWRTRPAEWAALHEASRHVLLREMRIGEL